MTRLAFVLIDGLGDVSLPGLGYRTPLQVARTPALDAIAVAGLNGLIDPVEPGLACGSDTAHLSLLGYDPRTHYRGRGAFESMGAGIEMAEGDIAFKCNFATYDPATSVIVKRRADRRFEEEGPILCSVLDGLRLVAYPDHVIRVKYATEHRCGVVISGPGLSDSISGTDPLKDNLPLQTARPTNDTAAAHFTAALVNELSAEIHSILESHPLNARRTAQGKAPANCVLLRGCGARIGVQSFKERHGLHACVVAPTRIIAGLAMSLGMVCLDVPGATGDYRTKLEVKAEAISNALTSGSFDFALLHVKAVDDTGHDRLPWMKVQYLQAVDQMVLQLLSRLSSANTCSQASSRRFAVCVASDHSTPVLVGDHSHEPVPFAIADLRYIVEVLGGQDAIASVQLGPIAHPSAAAEVAVADHQEHSSAGLEASRSRHGDSVMQYDELAAARGCLGRFPGSELMPFLKSVMGNSA